MDKVVKYVRVPVNNQKETLEEQQKELMQYAEEKGFEVAETGALHKKTGEVEELKGIFADEGTIAREIKNHRGAFKQMIDEAMQGKSNQIIVENVSIFARNVEVGMKTIRDLRNSGVNVHFRKERLDTIEPFNDMILAVLFCIEEKVIIERAKKTKKRFKN